ncbi:MAG: thioredoxin domain-containing protein [Candidatus Binatia bacterium]|nr:thioredoxin domain-containing protein [Candidatus Binatia bacterium]
MKLTFRSTAIAACAGLMVAALSFTPAAAQGDRNAKILGNLKLNMPQLGDMTPEMGAITPSGIEGLDQGSFTVRGRPYTFLVTSDDKKLWLLQGDAMDVSKGEAEIKVALAKREEEKKKEAAERTQKLAASLEGRPFRGKADAEVTIVEFSDFQCPYCTRGANTVDQILEKYPDDVKFVFQHFPLNFHPWAKPAAIAANCAGNQDQEAFWVLHDAYFKNQKALKPENVVANSKDYLKGSKVDVAVWEKCAGDTNSAEYKAEAAKVDADMKFGQSMGVSGTPGFFVNGEFLNGAQPITAFVPLIEKAKQSGS